LFTLTPPLIMEGNGNAHSGQNCRSNQPPRGRGRV
jgi:hypothetical protein